MMKKPLQVLILEDSADDAQLLLLQLEQDGIEVEWQRVETEAAFRAALDSQPDLILADYSLPSYSGIKALELRNELGLDIPFILVSGTMGEDIAVTAMQQGAADYLLKDRLARLGEAVRNALEEKRVRDEKRWAEEALRKSEERLRLLSEAAHDLTTLVNRQWIIEYTNTYAAQQFGVSPQELIGKKLTEIFPAEIANRQQTNLQKVFDSGQPLYIEAPSIFQGKTTWLGSWLVPVKDKLSDEANAVLVVSRDVTERKQAEDALRESEARYRLAARATNDVIWEWDPKTNELMWSENAQSIFGYIPEEIKAEAAWWDEHIHPEDHERVVNDINAFRESGGMIWADEYRFLRRDGSIAYIVDRAYVERDADGKPVRMIGAMSDITERKQAEEALRESEKRYRSLFENMLEGYAYCQILLDHDQPQDFIYIDVNNAFEVLTGLKNVVGKKVSEVIPGIQESNPELFEIYGRVALTGKPEIFETYLESLGIWFSIAVYSPRREYFVAVFDNITERKRAEEVLREKEHLLSESQRIAHIGSWSWDLTGPITWTDETYCIYGVSPETFTPTIESLVNLLHPEDRSAMQQWLEACGAGQSPDELEFRAILPDGSVRFLSGRGELIYDTENRPAYMSGTVQDITARKQAEAGLQDTRMQLEGIFNTTMDAILTMDEEQKIIIFNPAAEQMFGCPASEAIGQTLDRFLPESARKEHREYLRAFGQSNSTKRSMKTSSLALTCLRSDGEAFPSEISISQLEIGGKKLYTAIVRNITERKRTELELQHRKEDLELINTLNHAINRGESMDVLIDTLNNETQRIYSATACTVSLLSPDGKILTIERNTISPTIIKKIEQLIGQPLPKIHVPVREGGYIHKILQNEKGTITSDPKLIQQWIVEFTESTFISPALRGLIQKLVPQIYKILNIGSTLAVPLTMENRTIGLLELAGKGLFTEDTLRRVRNISGQVTAAILRKRAEDEIRHLKEFDENLINTMSEGIVVQNNDGNFTFVNPAVSAITGYLPEELLGAHWTKFIPADQHKIIKESDNRRLAGEASQYEIDFLHKSGKHINMLVSGSPLFENERFSGTMAVFTDITERKQAEEALRQSEEQYRSLFEDSPISLWVEDFSGVKQRLDELKENGMRDLPAYFREHPDFVTGLAGQIRILDVNNAAMKLYHAREKSELLGNLADVLHAMPLEQFENELIQVANGRLNFEREEVDHTLTGEKIHVNMRWSVAPGHEDSLAKVIVSTLDITERTQAEELIRQQSEQLRLLYEASQRLNRTLDLDEINQVICDFMSIIAPNDGFVISAFDSETQLISCLAFWMENKWLDVSSFPPIPLEEEGKGTQSIVIRTGQSMLLNDYQAQVKTAQTSYYVNDETSGIVNEVPSDEDITRSALIVPLKSGGTVNGVIQVMSYRLNAYTENQLKLLEALALHIASAEQNARLYAQVQTELNERKQAEEALKEKEHLLSEAQRIGHIGSWSYDIVADTLVYSDEMYRLFDVSPQEFQHNREGFLGAIYSSDRPLVAKWLEGIRAGRQTGELEFLVFRRNGELRYIHCRGGVEFDKTGKPARFIGTAQDVTERKLAEIQIRQQVERLTALRKIDQAISSSFDLNVTLDILLSQVISQLQVDAADVLLRDPDGRTFTYAAGKGFRTQAIETARLHMADSQAVRERRSIHVENLENKPDSRLLTRLGATEDFVCYFGLPLIVKGKVRGVLEVFHRAPLHPYPEWLDFLDTLAGQAAIAIEDATLFENLERSNRELSQAYDATIEGWSRALDLRDKETEGHSQRVTAMTMDLARAFRLPEEELLHIRRGALLHDIGKMGVPDNILLKPGELTEEEWVRMRTHPGYAYDLLKPIAFLAPALDIPYCHHEKWDGTGYPRGLKGQEIPLAARLFAVVDVWDALLSDRPYRKAWTSERAKEYIRDQAGIYFDPKVVETFLDMIKEG